MDQIPSSLRVPIALVIVVIAATLAQRKWGSKALLWVWIASTVIMMGVTVSWIFHEHGLPSIQELRPHLLRFALLVTFVFVGIAVVSGEVILLVAVLGPRPPQDSSAEVNYFLYNLPLGKLEDTNGHAGILWRYHEVLTTFLTALDKALASTLFNPYRSRLHYFLSSFQMYFPSYLRQARVDSRQFKQVPNALMRDLAGADGVLSELETLTAAQLSAIEECHRVNVRRLRQRTFLRWEWWGKITVLCGGAAAVIGYVVAAAENVAGVKPSDLWPLIRDIKLTGPDFQSQMNQVVIFGLVLFLFSFIGNIMTFLPILHRVQAFEDILTVAKAYRKGLSETTQPPAEPSLTATR